MLKASILVLKGPFKDSGDKGSYELSGCTAPYNVNFDAENGLLRLDKTYILKENL